VTVHLDFETRSAADIKKVGGVRYAMDPTTEVMCASYRFGKVGPISRWRRGDPPPADLVEAVRKGEVVCAHHAMFELSIWTYICGPKLGWGPLSPYQMDCTMARAHVMSLMGSLDGACTLLNVPNQKDKTGYAIMMKLCKPRKPHKDEDPNQIYWNEDPLDLARQEEYCDQDVRAETDLDEALPPLSPSEREVFHFDLMVNLRGFRLDTELMRRADKFLAEAKARVDARVNLLTDGVVGKSTQVERLKDWLRGRGIPVGSLSKGDIEDVTAHAEMFDDDVALEVVSLRRQGAKATSLAKYGSGLRCVGFDERARGLLQYHKASTGRWSGSLYQPHNLERIDPDEDGPLIEQMLHILREALTAADAVEWCELTGYTPMRAIGKCTRAMIVASEGHELIGCDYSNVEGRASAWLAREQWKVEAFRAYDAGTGPDLYKLAYSKAFGEPVESIGKGPKRQIGKVQELFLGYQGSVGAFMSGAANYGFKPDDIAAVVKPVAAAGDWHRAAEKFEGSNSFGLSKDTWTALKYVVNGWRAAHPNTVQCWWNIQDAVVEAVDDPGRMIFLFNNKVRVYCAKNRRFLHIYLPSGRALSYFRPKLKETKDGDGRVKRQVVVEGWDSRINHWGTVHLYGGLLWENIIQALCRDLLVHGLMNCEAAGYPVVLHVHDEGVFEVLEGQGDVREVQALMAVLPPWAGGFPLTSAAWRDKRYVK
jgi:DNA polymerase